MTKLITKDLTIANTDSVLEIFSAENGVDPFIQQAIEEANLLMADQDTSTQKGRDKIRSDAFKFAKLKNATDDLGADSIAEHNKTIKAVNANRKSMRDQFDILRDKVRAPLTKWEAEEELFKAVMQETKNNIVDCGKRVDGSGNPHTLEVLNSHKDYLSKVEVTAEKFRDLTDEIADLLKESIASNAANIVAEEKRLEDEVELERLRAAELERKKAEAEKAEAERIANEKKLADEQAEAARLKREQDIKDQAEREKQEAITKQQREAEKALAEEKAKVKALEDQKAKEESGRLAKIADEKAKADKLAANRVHVGKVRKSAKEDIIKASGVDEETAKKIVLAIAKGEVSSVSISY